VGIGLAFFLDGLDVTVRTSGQARKRSSFRFSRTLNEAAAGPLMHGRDGARTR